MKKYLLPLLLLFPSLAFAQGQNFPGINPASPGPIGGTTPAAGTFTTITTGKLNNICILDGVTNATLAATVTCAGSNGTIEISPGTSLTLTGNVTIPSGVTTKFDSNTGVNTTGFTLTINGPLQAPNAQIFSGTGTVTLGNGADTLGVQAQWFPGADCGAKINAASTAAGVNSIIFTDATCNGVAAPTISTALSIASGTQLRFAEGRYKFTTVSTISNGNVEISGLSWAQTFFDIGVATGDLFTVTGGAFKLHDVSIAACTVAACGSLTTRTTGAVVNIQAGGGKVNDIYITDPFRGFTANTCPQGQWTFEHIRVQSAGGNWDSFIAGGPCSTPNLLNSFQFNDINGNIKTAGTISAPFILLDSGVDTWQFVNGDFGMSGATTNTQPVVQIQSTGTSSPPRNVHFANVSIEAGTMANAMYASNGLDVVWVNGHFNSSLRGCLIQGGSGLRISQSEFINNQDEGCDVTVGAVNTQFISNHFSDNSQSSNNGFAALNFAPATLTFVAEDNECDQLYLGNANKSSVCIQVQTGASDNYRIVNNRADTTALGTPATPFIDNGSGINKTMLANMPASTNTIAGSLNVSVVKGTILQGTVGTQVVTGADYTNSTNVASTVFSWALPATAVAANYRYTCDILWESTAASLTGPQFGVNISAAPTQLTAMNSVQNTLAGADVNGYISNTTTGHQNVGAGTAAGVAATNYWAKMWGTIEGAAVAGSTFIIDAAALSSVTSTLNIRRGSGCYLN